MSVHRVFSSADSLRIKEAEAEAQAKGPRAKARKLTPKPKPIGWDVRWRQNGKHEPASVRLLVSDGFKHLDATELDAKIKRMKITPEPERTDGLWLEARCAGRYAEAEPQLYKHKRSSLVFNYEALWHDPAHRPTVDRHGTPL